MDAKRVYKSGSKQWIAQTIPESKQHQIYIFTVYNSGCPETQEIIKEMMEALNNGWHIISTSVVEKEIIYIIQS